MLQVLGLGPADEEVYLTVLARSGVAAGLPAHPVDRLVRAGLLVPDDLKPGRFRAADLSALLKRTLGGHADSPPGDGPADRPQSPPLSSHVSSAGRRPAAPGAGPPSAPECAAAHGGGTRRHPVGGELSAPERELLALLASGLTDDVVGRRLGVSYRTVQRRVHALMDRLGARTRFEAGARAAHRGWV